MYPLGWVVFLWVQYVNLHCCKIYHCILNPCGDLSVFRLSYNMNLTTHSSSWYFLCTSYFIKILPRSIVTLHRDTGIHDDVIKWKHFPRNWPFVRGIHRSPVNSPHKGQWRGALMFSLICVWINDWVNNRETGDLRRQRGHYDVIVMQLFLVPPMSWWCAVTVLCISN